MTPDERFIQMARFDAAHAKRIWDGSAATDDAPAWYGRVATLIRAAAAPATEDELAGESDVVARMEAAMLAPASEDELAGETDIVARMQATILGLAPDADDVAGDDPDRPRHLRPAAPWAARRQRARVVRRIVAVKAAAVTTVVAIGVTAAAATTGFVATVVVPALSSREPKVDVDHEAQPAEGSGSSADSSGDSDRGGADDGTGDDGAVTMDPEEPLVCMLDLDCLLHEVEVAAASTQPAPPNPAPGALAADGTSLAADPPADPSTAPVAPATETPTTTVTTEPPPTTTTTEPPPTTTTTEPPTTTTSTTEPPPPSPEQAAPLPGPETLSAGVDARAADLGEVAQPQPAG
jgi:hypothetical protein